ncbi:MAG: leucine-rich repeat protein [Bacteroidales bacterium]|nr:leucine-rich repeat protein [Bacteroidales bacterium]
MKRIISYFVLAASFIFAGCQQEEILVPENEDAGVLKAYIGDAKTRTHMGPLSDGVYKTLWSEGDDILVFSEEKSVVYTLASGADTPEGVFVGKGNMKECYAYYPAENVRKIDTHNNRIHVVFPSRQNYVKDSFEKGIYPMLAKGKDGVLNFQNILSVVQVNLTGTRRVDSLVFTKSSGSYLAGSYHIYLLDSEDFNPAKDWLGWNFDGDVPMSDTVTIDCGKGVQLKEDEVTSFHLVIPPGTYYGFSFKVYTPDGVMEKKTSNRLELLPSQLRAIPAFKFKLETDPDYEEDKVEFEEDRYYVGFAGGELAVPIQRNVPYTLSIYGTDDVSWLRCAETKTMQSDTLHFQIDPNDTPYRRTGYITFRYGEDQTQFAITQDAYEDPYIKLSGRDVTISPDGGAAEVEVSANRDELYIEADVDWIDVDVIEEILTNVGANTSYKLTKRLSISAGLNDTHAFRSGNVVVSSCGLTDTIHVSQEPAVYGTLEILIPEMGTLEDIVKGEDIMMYSEVRIIGPMNDDDISYFNRYADQVKVLDLSQVAFEGNVLDGIHSSYGNYNFGEFRALSSLRELYLPPELTSITNAAFEECTSLEKVDWGEDPQLTTIGTAIREDSIFDGNWIIRGPFSGCTSLKTIEIPSKVNTIMAGAFYNSGIEKVIFAENSSMVVFEPTVRYARPPLGAVKPGAETAFPVYFGMFYGCHHLEEIDFPSSVKYVRAMAFRNWTGLKRMTIPESVEYIETEYLFSGCSNLEYVSLPSSVTKVGNGMFANCSSLKSFDLTNYTSVGNGAFKGCEGLTEFKIDHLEEIGSSAFEGTGVVSVRLPDNMTVVPSNLFSNCTNLVELDLNKAEILDYYSFAGCSSLESVVLPSSVREVYGAFDNCSKLRSLKITGGSIYFDCAMQTTLEEVIIGKDVISATSYNGLFGSGINNSFNNFIFEEGSELEEFGLCGNINYMTEFHLPPTVKKLSKNAFVGCTRLTNITEIIANVEEIGDKAFYQTGAASIEFPEGLKRIGEKAFAGCEQLASITLPTTLEYIGSNAFSDNKRLIDPIIHGGNLVLGNGVFYGSYLIREVVIGAEVLSLTGSFGFDNTTVRFQEASKCTQLDGNLFSGCNNVVLPQGLQILGDDVFNVNDYMTQLEIPESVTTLGDRTFRECRKLESLVLPENITSIGSDVFYNCGAEGSRLTINFKRLPDTATGNMFNKHNFSYIELGPNVEYIGQKLTAEALYCKGDVPPVIGGKGQINVDVIYVPASSYQTYLSDWSQYADKIQMEN